MNASLSLHT